MSEYSVKRSDFTRNLFEWLFGENNVIRPPTPYFIVLDCYVKTLQVKAIEFHRIDLRRFLHNHGNIGTEGFLKSRLWFFSYRMTPTFRYSLQ